MISWWKIDFGAEEIELISQAICSRNISQGLVTSRFESEVCKSLGVNYAVATTSGSTAIVMALVAAGVGPGDEVIVPNRTWIATAHAPILLGAVPVIVDVQYDYPLLDCSAVTRSISKKTKAVIPVHLNGHSANIVELANICDNSNIKIIEDAAQAFGSHNSAGNLGTLSFAGCFSLSVAKLISTGQGGLVVTNDKDTYEKLTLIRSHGVRDMINTEFVTFGFNFRFNDILASIGIAQLSKLTQHMDSAIQIYERYRHGLRGINGIQLLAANSASGEIPVYVEAMVDKREEFIDFLTQYDIQTRPFYPNLDSAKHLHCSRFFPNSSRFERHGVFLPCGPGQNLDDIDYVIEKIVHYFRVDG